jgi:hypothetical protein
MNNGRSHTHRAVRCRTGPRPGGDIDAQDPTTESYENAPPPELDRIRRLLVTAQDTLASFYLAVELGEPQPVCNQLVEQVWDLLAEGLTPEQRITAILVGLGHAARAESDEVLHGIDQVPRL